MTTTMRRRTVSPWRWTLPVTLAALTTAVACSVDPAPSAQRSGGRPASSPTPPSSAPESTSSSTPSSRSAPASKTPSASGNTPIRVIVGDQTFSAELYDNPTARDLADQLPLSLTMDDLNRLEKTGSLPRALTTDGVPSGSDPDINEIGYYAPGRDLVLYYGDVGYYTGIIRIGRFDEAIDSIADAPDGVRVTIKRA
jgi:hypothetical protein